jgi:hypothetical protein
VLGRPSSQGQTEVTDDEAARLTEAYRVPLHLVGDGVALTSAGYLPPKLVEQFAERTGITRWWIGKANREDLTPPVAAVRETARALGLASVRKGRPARGTRAEGGCPTPAPGTSDQGRCRPPAVGDLWGRRRPSVVQADPSG